MKILIADDEELGRERLARMLSDFGYEYSVARGGEEVMELAKKEHFDIFILDINMPDIDGITLGYELKVHYPKSAIIYQTAHSEHSLKAFDVGAIHYLLKPFMAEELQNAIDRVTEPTNELRFMTKNKEEFYLLSPEDIFYIEADLNEVMFRTSFGFCYYGDKISHMAEVLGDKFFRIHRSCLINLSKIKNMRTVEQSKIEFSFVGIDDVVYSSKDGAKLFRNTFGHTEGN